MKAIGLDIGTTSVCGICCDIDTGEILQSVTCDNDTFLSSVHEWEKIQDAEALIGKIKSVAARLTENEKDVACIGVTGQMHGVVYIDRQGRPVSGLYTWQDGRGNLPFRDGETYASYLSKKTGASLASGYGAVTHFYHTVHHQIPPTAAAFCTIHDLAVMTLTGGTRPLLHPSDAESLGFYDVKRNRFDTDAISACGMDASFFPEVRDGYGIYGKTASGIPVAVAVGDNQASVIGSVSDFTHSVLVNVGTGSQVSCMIPGYVENSGINLRPLTDGLFLLAGSSLCGGRAYAILERFLRETASIVSGTEIKSAYPSMDLLMADFVPPENPLHVNTQFGGTRKDPNLRGSIRNIGSENLTMANLCYGFMKGMADELYEMYLQMKPLLPVLPDKMIGSGNGLRSNAPLAAIFREVFGLPLFIPAHKEEAAFGSALFGMVAAGIFPDLPSAQRMIRYL